MERNGNNKVISRDRSCGEDAVALCKTVDRVHHSRRDVVIRRKVVTSAWKRHQLRPGNQRREPSPFLETDHLIVAAVNHQGGRLNVREDVAAIPSAMARLLVAGGGLRIGRETLHLVEMSDQSRVGIAAEELTREDLTERRRISS